MSRIRNLENELLKTFEDQSLSNTEKHTLREYVANCTDDQTRFLKNRSFDIFRDFLVSKLGQESAEVLDAYRWLEKTIKVLDGPPRQEQPSRSYFSPGEACLEIITRACKSAKNKIDICVFTISDDRISQEILAAHQRGIDVRIISDNHKSEDRGSDIDALAEQGLAVRLDETRHHMHHKFAIFDETLLINGSFNWTRSASQSNEENIVTCYETSVIKEFCQKFEALWRQYA